MVYCMYYVWIYISIFFATVLNESVALNNGIALTPPMGWLSWVRYGCNTDCKDNPTACINENLYMAMADELVSGGYKDLGYVYVNIDDCWAAHERDNVTKQLVADPIRFPHGIKWLANYMHKRGLKLGIYADFGTHTCAGYPGSAGFFDIDARTFAAWEVDSVKVDGCSANAKTAKVGYSDFGKALNKTNRAILYSCEWPLYEMTSNLPSDYDAIGKICNIFRNYFDIGVSFNQVKSTIDFYELNTGNFLQKAGPGRFNDPDMLVIGNSILSFNQQRVQMGMWAMFAAPMFMSNDLRLIDRKSVEILQNKLAIAINQDPLGKSATPSFTDLRLNFQIWTRKLSGGRFAVAALNFQQQPTRLSCSLDKLKVEANAKILYEGVDVFDKYSIGLYKLADEFKFFVNSTAIQLILFTPLIY